MSSLSVLATSLNSLKSAAAAARTSVLAPGQASVSQVLVDFSSMEAEEQKRQMGGALLELNDGSLGYAPFNAAVIRAGQPDFKISVKLGDDPNVQAVQRDQSWCIANVKRYVPGLLTIGSRSGAFSQEISINGYPVKIEVVPNPVLTELKVTVDGSGDFTDPVLIALGKCTGVAWRPYKGGTVGPIISSALGIPSVADSKVATISIFSLSGGGLATRRARLFELKLTDPVVIETASLFIANLTGDRECVDALSVAIHTGLTLSPAGASSNAAYDAVLAARSAVFDALGALLDRLSDAVLADAVALLAGLRAAGLTGPAAGGNALSKAISRAPPSAEEQVLALQQQVTAMQAGHPPPMGLPVTPPPRSIGGAAVHPAAAPLPAPGPAPSASTPAVISAASPAAQLHGFDALRQLSTGLGAAVPSNLDVLVGLGGADVATRLAKMNGITDPMVDVAGPGGTATADQASDDFGAILNGAREADDSAEFAFVSPPADAAAAVARLYAVMRAVQRSRSAPVSGCGYSVAPPPVTPERGSSTHDPLASKPLKALGEKSKGATDHFRAVGGAAVDSLASAATVQAERLALVQANLSDEGARLMGLYGSSIYALTLSNMYVDEEIAGEIPATVFSFRSHVLSRIRRHIAPLVGAVRLAEAESEVREFAKSTLSGHFGHTLLIKLCGAIAPTVEHTGGVVAGARSRGSWGVTTGASASADRERAMLVFGPLLVLVFHTILGGPAPVDAGYGLLMMAQESRSLQPEAAQELFESTWSVIATKAHSLRNRCATLDVAHLDIEAQVFTARSETLARIQSIADSAECGAAAGKRAAQEALASFSSIGTSTRHGGKADDKTPSPTKKQKRAAERAAAAAAAATPPAPADAAAAAAASAPTTAIVPYSGPQGTTYKPDGKRTLTVGSAGGVACLCAKDGNTEGLIDALDRLHGIAMPALPSHHLPCAWTCAKGACTGRKDVNGQPSPCPRCTKGTAADPSVLLEAKGLCNPKLLASMGNRSLVGKA